MQEEGQGDLRDTRGGGGCGRSGMEVDTELVGEGAEEEELGGSGDDTTFGCFGLKLVGVVVGEEEGSRRVVVVGEEEVVGSRLVGRDMLLGNHMSTS